MDDERTPKEERSRRGNLVGVGLAVGAGVGAVLLAITGNPVWIGVMAGSGAAIGAARSTQRR